MITRNNNQLKKILEEKDKELKTYEKAFQDMKNKKEEYELNNILLQRQFNNLKAEKESESLEKENNIKDTGIKNRDKIIEEYMKKFSDIDNEKQKYYDKYSKMSEEFQKLSKAVIEEKLKLEEEDEKLRQENIQLQKENESMQNIISKHNIELTQRDEIINNLRNNLNEINLKIKSNFDKANDSINQLSILFNKDKMEWQNERQDLLNQIDFLTLKLNELKNINEKIENEKNDFRNNSKRYISQIIEEKMNQLDSN
jgi:chromosome segregation ATPase